MHIKLDQLCKKYGSQQVLDHISAEILPGTLLAMIGINGAGKTTLLNMLAGVAGRDDGDILFDEESAKRDNIAQRRKLFFLPDFPVLFDGKSPLENIAIYLKLWQVENPPPHEEIMSLLEELDLLKLGKKRVSMLSRGQAYKIALACLILVDPELWLIDEPFASGMDPQGIAVFKKHARLALERDRTIIYTTQLLELAESFSSHIWLLNDSQLAVNTATDRISDFAENLPSLFTKLREK